MRPILRVAVGPRPHQEVVQNRTGRRAVFNTDQGSQFTSNAFVDMFAEITTQLSMDGKGCWRNNVFVERFWRSIKYEEVYLHAYETVADARSGIGSYIELYNRGNDHPQNV